MDLVRKRELVAMRVGAQPFAEGVLEQASQLAAQARECPSGQHLLHAGALIGSILEVLQSNARQPAE